VAWRCVRKWDFTKSQNALEEEGYSWVLVADRGFRRVELLRELQEAGIPFVIRLKDDVWMEHEEFTGRLADLRVRPGGRAVYRGAVLHRTKRLETTVVVTHREPAVEPWYLATNLEATPLEVERIYGKRGGIEQQIRDSKSGLGLKGLRLKEAERVERMLILVALAFLLIALTAIASRKRGERVQVTTSKRKSPPASYFTIGARIIELYPSRLSTNLKLLHAT